MLVLRVVPVWGSASEGASLPRALAQGLAPSYPPASARQLWHRAAGPATGGKQGAVGISWSSDQEGYAPRSAGLSWVLRGGAPGPCLMAPSGIRAPFLP